MSTHPNPYLSPQPGTPDPPVLAQLVGGEGLSLEYEVTFEDLRTFTLFHHKNSPTNRRQMRVAMILVAVIFLAATTLVILLTRDEPDSWLLAVMLGVGGCITTPLMPSIYRWRLSRLVQRMYREGRNLALFGPRRVSMSHAFLSYASPYVQSLMRWVAVERVVSSPEAIYIYISSASAHIIPRRAFASDEDFQTFARTAAEYSALALGTEMPSPLAMVPRTDLAKNT